MTTHTFDTLPLDAQVQTLNQARKNAKHSAFNALTHDDLYTIIDALQAKVRSTEAFIHNQIEPIKDKYPTLLKAYSKLLDDESTTLHRFKAIVYDEL